MAIFYYSGFSKIYQSSNFGDDVNPILMNNLFDSSLVKSRDVCIMGVGTLINKDNIISITTLKRSWCSRPVSVTGTLT